LTDNPLFHLEAGVPVFEKRLNELDRKAAESETRDENFKKEQLRIDKLVMVFTGVLAVIGILGFALSTWQARIANRSAKAAESAAMTARNTLQLDQRAWVGPLDYGGTIYEVNGKKVYLKDGEKPQFQVVVSNFGRSPAINFKSLLTMRVFKRGEPFTAIYETPVSETTVSTLFPGTNRILMTMAKPEGIARQSFITAFSRQDYIYYIYGQLTYDDIFKVPHTTHFCGFLAVTIDRIQGCGSYNDAD